MKETFQMKAKEVDKYHVIKQVISKKIKQKEAAQELDLSKRQIIRLVKRVKAEGINGIIHGLRGKKSNNKLAESIVQKVDNLVKTTYKDFGPTLASEKLEERDKVKISVSALRQRMISNDEWQPKKQKQRHRKWRNRRSRLGELIQIDASPHDWFEGRGEPCNLINFVDDATSKVVYSMFVKSEDKKTLMRLFWEFIIIYGRPVSIYVDKHSIYKVNRQATIEEDLKDAQPKTQFARAMEELNIELICAHSPQAKGRVERAFGVDQDRLIKEMRLEKINNMEAGNKFLHEYYLEKRNKKFSVEPRNLTSAFRPLLSEHKLNSIFSSRTERKIQNDYTVQYKNKWFQITKDQKKRVYKKNNVEVEDRLDGSIHLRYKEIYLEYKEITKQQNKRKKTKVATRKEINQMQSCKPGEDHPWKQNYPNKQKKNQIIKTIEYIPAKRAVEEYNYQ